MKAVAQLRVLNTLSVIRTLVGQYLHLDPSPVMTPVKPDAVIASLAKNPFVHCLHIARIAPQ
jgi:hypothetical protein